MHTGSPAWRSGGPRGGMGRRAGGLKREGLCASSWLSLVHSRHAHSIVKQLPSNQWCSNSKASTCNVGDPGSVPELGRSPGEGNGNPLQYSCLENPMEGGACHVIVHGVAKSRTRLSNFTFWLLCLELFFSMRFSQKCPTSLRSLDQQIDLILVSLGAMHMLYKKLEILYIFYNI